MDRYGAPCVVVGDVVGAVTVLVTVTVEAGVVTVSVRVRVTGAAAEPVTVTVTVCARRLWTAAFAAAGAAGFRRTVRTSGGLPPAAITPPRTPSMRQTSALAQKAATRPARVHLAVGVGPVTMPRKYPWLRRLTRFRGGYTVATTVDQEGSP